MEQGILRTYDLNPDGIRIVVRWNKFVVGTSIFIPCIDTVKAVQQIDCKVITCRKPVFPRTDPAVIMLVYDDDRILLGRQSIWKKGMYSTLAGFLEPGETLEEAVAREVFEEANIEVEDVSYHSSQPWPFPASIMLGFYAKARSTEIRRNDEEVEDVQWFTRGEVSQFSKLGKSLPRKDSIARCLIEDWLRNDF